MAVSWPFVVLEIYPSDLVVRSPQGAFEPVALSRDAISRLRIDRSVFGVSLKVEGTDGREIDFSFSNIQPDVPFGRIVECRWAGGYSRNRALGVIARLPATLRDGPPASGPLQRANASVVVVRNTEYLLSASN